MSTAVDGLGVLWGCPPDTLCGGLLEIVCVIDWMSVLCFNCSSQLNYKLTNRIFLPSPVPYCLPLIMPALGSERASACHCWISKCLRCIWWRSCLHGSGSWQVQSTSRWRHLVLILRILLLPRRSTLSSLVGQAGFHYSQTFQLGLCMMIFSDQLGRSGECWESYQPDSIGNTTVEVEIQRWLSTDRR